jgi:hypothetical protein
MIEMNMAQENVANVFRFDAQFVQTVNDVVKSGLRTGVKQRDPILRFQCGGSNDTAMTELQSIEDVRVQRSATKVGKWRRATRNREDRQKK